MDANEFMASLRQAFPELVDELDEVWRGLLHLEMGCLARNTQRAIDSHAATEVDRCFEFARSAWLEGDNDVTNALGVSYIEHLNFDDGKVARTWAFARLAAPLQAAARSLGTAPKTAS